MSQVLQNCANLLFLSPLLFSEKKKIIQFEPVINEEAFLKWRSSFLNRFFPFSVAPLTLTLRTSAVCLLFVRVWFHFPAWGVRNTLNLLFLCSFDNAKQEKYVKIYRLRFEAFYHSMFCTILLFGPDYKYRLKTFVSNVIKKNAFFQRLGWDGCVVSHGRMMWLIPCADWFARFISVHLCHRQWVWAEQLICF